MDEQYVNDLVSAVAEQRNAALNECARLYAEVQKLRREIDALKSQHERANA